MAETVKKKKAPAKPKSAAAKTKAAEPVAISTYSREQVAELAHKYWAERGRQHGSAEQDWLRAEQELRGIAS